MSRSICTNEIASEIEKKAIESSTDLLIPKSVRACAKLLASRAFDMCALLSLQAMASNLSNEIENLGDTNSTGSDSSSYDYSSEHDYSDEDNFSDENDPSDESEN